MAVFILTQEKQIKQYAMSAEKIAVQPKYSEVQISEIASPVAVPHVPKHKHEVETTSFLTGKDSLILFSAFLFVIGALVFLVTSRNGMTQVSNELQNIEGEISELSVTKSNLTQEVQELSRYDRVMDVAESRGLQMNEENIRNVEK